MFFFRKFVSIMAPVNLNERKMNRVASRQNESSDKSGTSKKPFDKKKYRLKKYSNKYKVDKWENKRKKTLLRDLYADSDKKKQRNSGNVPNPADHAENADTTKPGKKPSSLLAAKLENKRRQNEMKRKKEELLKAKAERHEALERYKVKKAETYKKLSRKTKKGQPVMKDRLELLLAKIQNET